MGKRFFFLILNSLEEIVTPSKPIKAQGEIRTIRKICRTVEDDFGEKIGKTPTPSPICPDNETEKAVSIPTTSGLAFGAEQNGQKDRAQSQKDLAEIDGIIENGIQISEPESSGKKDLREQGQRGRVCP